MKDKELNLETRIKNLKSLKRNGYSTREIEGIIKKSNAPVDKNLYILKGYVGRSL